MEQWLYDLRTALEQHWMAWAVFAAQLLVTWAVAGLAKRILRWIAHRVVSRSDTTLDDRLVEAGTPAVRWVILALGLRLALMSLGSAIPSFQAGGRYATQFTVAGNLAEAVVVIAVTVLVNALINAALDWYLHELAGRTDGTWDRELMPMIKKGVSAVVGFFALSIVLELFGISVSALIATAGVASAAIALASQDTLSNMLGGLAILIDRPFRVGDWIELTDGKVGVVVEIGLRTTRIRQFDGTALVVPNKDMANTRVINYALPSPQAAIRQTIRVTYDTDVEKAKKVLLDVLQSHPEVLKDPVPGVWLSAFNTYSLDLFFSCWVDSYTNRFRVTDELNMQILKAFRENGIALAIPAQHIRIQQKEDSLDQAVELPAPDGNRPVQAVPGDPENH
ncbi:mechanosensitive ion channel family protein [Symbiobacterium thermophilum]|uniref:mechanosensitive ion channel family protein n=1 Tax=Symbiobacterium thermophilum TaxID=2734 RepID=UPI0002F1D084|nr:mechanosensitive ion channel family protein [Symbiobacterium thermophilum]